MHNVKLAAYGATSIAIPNNAATALRDAGLIVSGATGRAIPAKRHRRYSAGEHAARIARTIAPHNPHAALAFLSASAAYLAAH